MFFDQVMTLNTREDFLALKFRNDLEQSQIERFIRKWGLVTEYDTGPYHGIIVVKTKNAFESFRRLQPQKNYLDYVGPVFVWGTCYGEWMFQVPGNEIALKGDTNNAEIQSLLSEGNATLVRSSEVGDLYSLPWGDVGRVFNLANELHNHATIEWATPNFISQGCRETRIRGN
jgi:hypothetical protein